MQTEAISEQPVTDLPPLPADGAEDLPVSLDTEAMPDTVPLTAIEQAAAQLPADKVAGDLRQPALPGTRPPFDFASAWDSIMSQRSLVKNAEEASERAASHAKKRKKELEEEQTALTSLLDDFEERRKDILGPRAEATGDGATPRKACAFEIQTKQPCPICSNPTANHSAPIDVEAHAAAAAVVAMLDHELRPDTLRDLIATIAKIQLPLELVDQWPDDTQREAALFLEQLAQDDTTPRPGCFGQPHEVGNVAGSCRACGTLLYPIADSLDMAAFDVGQLVGVDCPGEPAKEPARTPSRRHATRSAAVKAKQAATREPEKPTRRTRPAKKATKPARRRK